MLNCQMINIIFIDFSLIFHDFLLNCNNWFLMEENKSLSAKVFYNNFLYYLYEHIDKFEKKI